MNLFADADQFRIYHAVGRFRGTVMAAITTTAAFTFLSGGKGRRGGGIGAMQRFPFLAAATFCVTWKIYYEIFSRNAGWTADKYNEF